MLGYAGIHKLILYILISKYLLLNTVSALRDTQSTSIETNNISKKGNRGLPPSMSHTVLSLSPHVFFAGQASLVKSQL